MPDRRRVFVEGLAAYALTYAQMCWTEDQARAALLGLLQQAGVTDVQVVRDAAAAVSKFPQPPEETAEETERMDFFRQMLGATSPTEWLAAALTAREWLARMADDLIVE